MAYRFKYAQHSNNKFNNNKQRSNETHQPQKNVVVPAELKVSAIKYIYDTVDLSNFRYKVISYKDDLTGIKNNEFYVSPNFSGIHSLLVFTIIKGKYLSFIVDRKTLSYNFNQINHENIKFLPFNAKLNISIYDGTIFDGVLLFNYIDGVKYFIINDAYQFKGESMIKENMVNKMINIKSYLENYQNTNNQMLLEVNKLYELKEIKNMINTYIPKTPFAKIVKGVTFYPNCSGVKLLYLYNNCDEGEDKIEPIQKTESPTFTLTSQESEKVYKADEVKTFKMKKTNIADVYKLFLGKIERENGKNIIKHKKIGIACIPTKECSILCKNIFLNKEIALVDCKYDDKRNKWLPIKENFDKKHTDLM